MALKLITITIDEEGDQTVDLTGFHGKGCDAVADVFGRALGTTTKVVHKPEHARPLLNKRTVQQ